MAFLSVIRRWHFRDDLSIREICRRTGLSRNTIRKYLRGGDVEPRFKVPERPSKLDPFADRFSVWLKTESKKSRKQKRTMKQLHSDLVSLGYDGSYCRVAAFAREWKADRQRELQTTGRGTFVPLAFEPGEAFQFDWSEDWAVIGNERTKLQVAHTKLSYSRAFIVRAYLLQTHEMLFDAHNHAFRVFGGIPGRGIYDNMRTAIDKVGRGKERDVNIRFMAMASHYLFEPEFCNPAAGWEKGQVEKNVQDARHRFFQPTPRFPSLEALNDWLEIQCKEFWAKTLHGQTIYDWRHYLAVVQRKPGALRNGAPFAELPDAFKNLQQYLLKKPGGDREMVDILALVLQHDEQAVLKAVEMALKSGVPTKTHVLNLLHRLVDSKSFTPPTLDAPQALTLTNEPKANVERYDTLRKTEVRHAS